MKGLLIAAFVLGLLTLLSVLFSFLRRRLVASLEARIEDRYPGAKWIKRAPWVNYVGQRFADGRRTKVRGNGALLLGDEVVVFLMAASDREIVIRLDEVEEVRLERAFLGRAVPRHDVLVVVHQGNKTGYLLRDEEAWAEAIRAAKKRAWALR